MQTMYLAHMQCTPPLGTLRPHACTHPPSSFRRKKPSPKANSIPRPALVTFMNTSPCKRVAAMHHPLRMHTRQRLARDDGRQWIAAKHAHYTAACMWRVADGSCMHARTSHPPMADGRSARS